MTETKKKIGTMNLILLLIGILIVAFSIAMTVIYCVTGGIPDTLVTCVFTLCGGECGVLGWIKTTKERKRERMYELEDRELASGKEDL